MDILLTELFGIINGIDLEFVEGEYFPRDPVKGEVLGTVNNIFTRKLYVYRRMTAVEYAEVLRAENVEMQKAFLSGEIEKKEDLEKKIRHINDISHMYIAFITELLWFYVKNELVLDCDDFKIEEGWKVVIYCR